MKLYSRTGAASVTNDDYDGSPFTTDKDGAIEVPDELGRHLHNLHIGGKQAWEDDVDRHKRLVVEEAQRRADPASLLDAVNALADRIDKRDAAAAPTAAELRELAAARRVAAEEQAAADEQAILDAENAEAAAIHAATDEADDKRDAETSATAPDAPKDAADATDGDLTLLATGSEIAPTPPTEPPLAPVVIDESVLSAEPASPKETPQGKKSPAQATGPKAKAAGSK
jgi:hypothetical protein